MKVEVNSSAFAAAVAWISRIIPVRPASPILTGVKLEVLDGLMNISAFDYEQSARCSLEAGVDKPGEVVVAGKLLADIAKSLPTEKTYISLEDKRLKLVAGTVEFNIPLMAADQYPQLPELPQKIGQIDGKTFLDAISQAAVAIAHNEARPVLTGIQMKFDGKVLVLNATDRYRLSRVSVGWSPEKEDISAIVLIRGSLLRDIAKSVDDVQNVIFYYDEGSSLMGFENAGRISTVQLIDGQFPEVDKLFSDKYPIQAVLDRKELTEAIRRVSLVAAHDAPIRMEFTENCVRLAAGDNEESQASELMEIDLDGDSLTVGFNPRYLVEALSIFPEPYVRMRMTEATAAVEFDGQQEKDDDPSLGCRHLLVPMKFLS